MTIAEPLVADAGPDTTVCDNAFLQLTGFPATDAAWSGTTGVAQNGLVNDATGLLHPGPMAPGTYDYLIEYGVGDLLHLGPVTVTSTRSRNSTSPARTPSAPTSARWTSLRRPRPAAPGLATASPTTDGTYVSGRRPAVAPAYTYEDPLTGCRDTLDAVTIHPVPVAAFEADTFGLLQPRPAPDQQQHGTDHPRLGLRRCRGLRCTDAGLHLPGRRHLHHHPDHRRAGCQDTTAQDVDITNLPVADFLLTPDSGCAPLDVEFANLSDAPYGTYLWTVNGDEFDQEAPPQLNFNQGDSVVDYSVSLLASNLCGNDILNDAIVVYPAPVMVFAFEEDTVCSPFEMQIINASTGLPNDVTWDFGDGTGFMGSTRQTIGMPWTPWNRSSPSPSLEPTNAAPTPPPETCSFCPTKSKLSSP